MSQIIKTEKCKMCGQGTVEFFHNEYLQGTYGACDTCGYCCRDKQDNMLTVNLDDDTMESLTDEAKQSNTTPQKVAAEILKKYASRFMMS